MGKPSSVEKYFSSFIEELNRLLENGIYIKNIHFQVQIMCFICDRPARSFIKCIKSHNAYYGCERCEVKGVYFNNRVIYPLPGQLRTDVAFREQKNLEHHVSVTPLTKISPPIDMVHDFVLDSMHLLYLGIMKKLLTEYWLTGATKLKKQKCDQISQRLTNMSNLIPCDFQRIILGNMDVFRFSASG